MRILIVTQYFYPEGFRINEVAYELVKRGHVVEVITGMPNYPFGKIFHGYEDKLEEEYYGVKIHRTNTRPRYTGAVNLFRNYISFMFQAKKRIRKLDGDFDIVFCYMPSPVFQLSPAIYAKKIFGAKLVCMCCDQWPESLKAGGLNSGPIFNLIALYCKKVFIKCDHIINVAPSFIEYNKNVNGVDEDKMSWMLQHSEDSFKDVDTIKTVSTDTVDLMFAGNIGKVQNVEDIIQAYNTLRYKNLRIHIFGDGSSFETCRKLVDDYGLNDNVIMYGRVSSNELVPYYKKMDACLLTLSGKTAIGNTIPAKLSGYLSASKPVIAAISGDSRLIINEARCGLCAEPDDYLALAKIIAEFYENKNEYLACGVNGRKYFEKYCTIDYFVNNLEEIFEKQKKGEA